MRAEVKFSSKRFLMTLTLCACSVILLQNYDLDTGVSFTFNILALLTGLSVSFLFFLPAIFIRRRKLGDVLSIAAERSKPERYAVSAVYFAYCVYAAEYFLLPYTDMFCKKYYTDTSPCFIALILLGCCVYAAFKGANVITRFGLFLFALAMLTNILMFGGSLSSLRLKGADFGIHGSASAFFHNAEYFITPCFISVIFACLSGYTGRFKLRQPIIAIALTGLKFALVLFFITFAVGGYALRQEYQTFVLSRVAHFGAFAGVESFYMALSTMSVFMIVSLLLCAMRKAVNKSGSVKLISAFAAILFGIHTLAVYNGLVYDMFTNPMLLNAFSLVTAVIIPSLYLKIGRNQRA